MGLEQTLVVVDIAVFILDLPQPSAWVKQGRVEDMACHPCPTI